MKKAIILTATIIISGFLMYGVYQLTKNLSYYIFYEDMVKQTIIEMVKPETLKGN